MSRKPASIAPEANAVIDRTMATLNAMKSQLKAKKLNGRALHSLLDVALDELRTLEAPFQQMRYAEIDQLLLDTRRMIGSDEDPEA
jgi:hypothetical protein